MGDGGVVQQMTVAENATARRRLRYWRRGVLADVGFSIAKATPPTSRISARQVRVPERTIDYSTGEIVTKHRVESVEYVETVNSLNNVAWRRVCACGEPIADVVTTAVNAVGGYSYISGGVGYCASVWACPVCAAKIRKRRTDDVEYLATWNAARGGRLLMLTLTLRHTRKDTCKLLAGGLTEAWRKYQRLESWQGIRQQLDGFVHAMEVTHGFGSWMNVMLTKNGWHPHLHLLLIVPPGTDAELLADELRSTADEWADSVVKELGEHYRPSLGRGMDVREITADSARYVTKISQEVTRADLKTAMRQPWEIIDRMSKGDKKAVAQWTDYVEGTKGKSAVRWSRGLRALCGLGKELTDAEIMAQLDDDGRDVEEYTADAWRLVHRVGGECLVFEGREADLRALQQLDPDWSPEGDPHRYDQRWRIERVPDRGGG